MAQEFMRDHRAEVTATGRPGAGALGPAAVPQPRIRLRCHRASGRTILTGEARALRERDAAVPPELASIDPRLPRSAWASRDVGRLDGAGEQALLGADGAPVTASGVQRALDQHSGCHAEEHRHKGTEAPQGSSRQSSGRPSDGLT